VSPRRKTVSIAALSAAVSLATGIVAGATRAVAYTEGIAEAHAVEPVSRDFHRHIEDVSKALQPGGTMHDFKERSELRDAYLVDSIAALCRATPRANCPSPAGLVAHR
jgi:hypothetical protein